MIILKNQSDQELLFDVELTRLINLGISRSTAFGNVAARSFVRIRFSQVV